MIDLILLEDEPILRQELGEFLDECGYSTTLVGTLAEFEQHFDAQRHHLAIIDVGLPDGDGLQLVRRLRQAGHRLGVVVLTARDSKPDKIAGLDGGADHYLGKHTDLDELAATLDSLARRLDLARDEAHWTLQQGPRLLLAPGGTPVRLSQQDLQVLECLMGQAGEGVSRQRIVEALGEDFLHYDQRRLDTQMRRLRRNVEAAGGPLLPVKTLRNAGYCFYAPVRIQD